MNPSPPISEHVLVVEDEPRLASVVCDYLHAAGYSSQWIADGAMVMDSFQQRHTDLVLLDLMLPNRDGIALCRDIRAISAVPVIMVTARVEEVDRLLGLEVGADDYICKPFSPREVVARIKAVLRRHKYVPQQHTSAIQIDEQAHRAALHGQWLDLTPIEFRLLRILAMTPGRVWSRDHLMNHLYDDHRIITDRTVDSHVRNLRRKLSEAGGGEDPVPSIYGVGYRLEMGDAAA